MTRVLASNLAQASHAGNPSIAHLSGVELYRMGQRGHAGRYPLHWHLVDDKSASYVPSSSIHHGLQREVAIHDNHAAGSYLGQGFSLEHGGMNKRSLRSARSAAGDQGICDFRNNLSCSNYAGLGSPDLYPPLVRGFGLFTHRHDIDVDDGRKSFCSFNGFQSCKNQHGGIWTEHGTITHDAIVSDSHVGIAGGHRIHDVVLVGQSENSMRGQSEHP
ncbi:MAG: hypothetical protein V2J42_00050 [Wenzhouxiangella sp.]|nr:hypothetical protein [Wenzhouxiangella sp.]